jgi:lipoprotein NlpD
MSKTHAAVLSGIALAACTTQTHRAPVEDRAPARASAPIVASTSGSTAPAMPPALPPVATPSVAPVPAAGTPEPAAPRVAPEPTTRPGFYTVRPGDTLIRIGLETGQHWRDLARWNSIDNPNVLEVGQVIRVAPPPPDPNAATARPVPPAGRIESRPLEPPRPAPSPAPASPATSQVAVPAPGASSLPTPPSTPSALPMPPPTPVPAVRDGDDDVVWSWPAPGAVTTAFDEARNKGVAIAGRAGDPILAAADGRVVYAGSGLRGYGNLVIVKHNNTYLTAYAHNQALLVKEDQLVKRGQKIAEMGSTDADRVQLHFEVRRQGKPVDPSKVLPAR